MTREALRRVTSLTDVRPPKAEPWPSNIGVAKIDVNSTSGLMSLPPVATTVAILLILFYNMAERWGIEEESHVGVSWQKVIIEKEVWRLGAAHFFHFTRPNFIINVTSVMALGRYLEKKIRRIPMILLILFMGVLANIFHMILCTYICVTPEDHYTSGFSHVVFGLKMVQVLAKDTGKRRGPALLLGFIPMYLGNFAPWEPLFEGVLSDVLVKGKHFATHMAGVLAGLCFPLLDYYFHDTISVPSMTSLSFSASSGSQTEENRSEAIGKSYSEDLERVMKVLSDERESQAKLFHELPSEECITLFYRHLPMKETSVHDQYSSKSDTYLIRK